MAVKRKDYVYLVRWSEPYFGEEIQAFRTRAAAHRARPRAKWTRQPVYLTLELKK